MASGSLETSRLCLICLVLSLLLSACAAQETKRVLEPATVDKRPLGVAPATVAIGEFVNRSSYMSGIFAGSTDRLGKQAEQILVTHLSNSPAFEVVDRRNLESLAREAGFSKQQQTVKGATGVVTGAVTEFGRKETGTRSLGGIIHQTKTQTLYAKVALSLVDVRTSSVLGSYQGAGEYALTNKEVLGTGGRAGYDSTLADKVLNLAIMEAVEQMVQSRVRGDW